MKHFTKTALFAGLMLGAMSQPALGQSTGTIVQGIAVANLDAVVASSNAYRTAQQQRQTTYKPQIDAANAKRQQLQTQLQPLATKFNQDRQATNPNQQSLAQQAQNIQRIQEQGQQELQQILQPVALSEAYVAEQLNDQLDQAVKNAMAKRNISLVLTPSAVLAANNQAYNLNQAILDELNTLVPSVQIVPPQGWEPREVREARAAQAQAQGQAPATTAQQPQGR
ncbi:hypothetical protein GCM10011371_31540 [Novosphingobium marinum]|uniref:Skp family chaperone for outer membrane proteins n=1 Tax=Novosphingobium marinum TaxID=1514948 RepID=A0A7Z0BX10_9SPHN|nr:OmpH family outer membrane protein [Novosphingobium marinum]NYH96862.1 Skp family chaperone for outer membrane proteins [Novosphingobium marinum]GGC41789.1 hypothetical protein GCM10011371_31540 [Novosphingobium marinum]